MYACLHLIRLLRIELDTLQEHYQSHLSSPILLLSLAVMKTNCEFRPSTYMEAHKLL